MQAKPVRIVSGAAEHRIVDVSPKAPRIDAATIEKAFGAKPVGSSAGMDLLTVRQTMTWLLKR